MTEEKIDMGGANIPKMQKVPITKGAEIPAMQAVEPNNGIPLGQTIPAMQPVTSATAPATSTQGNSEASKQSDK